MDIGMILLAMDRIRDKPCGEDGLRRSRTHLRAIPVSREAPWSNPKGREFHLKALAASSIASATANGCET